MPGAYESVRAGSVDGRRAAFDVRLGGREARLVLARPLEADGVTILRLEIAFPLGARLDVRAGARAFRDRAGTSRSGELGAGFDRLLREAAERGVSLRLDARDHGLHVVLDLGRGTSQIDGRVEVRGQDLLFVPSADASPDVLLAASSALGLDVEEASLVFRRGFRRLLVETLAWHGWRAPAVEVPVRVIARPAGLWFAWGERDGEDDV